ncbi:hypothetical protein KCU65_g3845, partial [Aureobasidium melanogenum]
MIRRSADVFNRHMASVDTVEQNVPDPDVYDVPADLYDPFTFNPFEDASENIFNDDGDFIPAEISQPAEASSMNAICDDVNLGLLEQGLTSAKALDEDDGLFCDAAEAELLAEPTADGLFAEQINGQMFVSTYSRINIVNNSSILVAYSYKQKSLEELFAVHATSGGSRDPPTLYRSEEIAASSDRV